MHFEYTADGTIPTTEITSSLENYINNIIPLGNQRNMHVQRIMKVYGKDRLILVKPKQLRYWLPSIALRDADETLADYLKARYQNA